MVSLTGLQLQIGSILALDADLDADGMELAGLTFCRRKRENVLAETRESRDSSRRFLACPDILAHRFMDFQAPGFLARAEH